MKAPEILPDKLLNRVGRLLGKQPVMANAILGRGFSAALRFTITFADDSTFFVKAATTTDTAKWLNQEKAAYEALDGFAFLPKYYGFGEPGEVEEFPFLVLEDLTSCYWPPPWCPEKIESVLTTLSEIHEYQGDFSKVIPTNDERDSPGWRAIADDPQPYLSLGICTASWLENALPLLLTASDAAPLEGNSLLHLDVRSDNLAVRSDGRAVLFDWNWARRGNPDFDIACWLPSLENEGGPSPETILPQSPELAAWISGYFAAQAGLSPPVGAPRVRGIQKQQLGSALPWAVRALGLRPLDGSSML